MRNYTITKKDLECISYNENDGTLTIKWWTGGEENAVCGLILKVDLVDKIISNYKTPYIPYNPNYNEPF